MRLMALAAALSAALVVSGCSTLVRVSEEVSNIIQGSGTVVTETRDVGRFDAIVLETAADLELTQGSDERVEIAADDNLVGYFTTEVSNGTLYLGYDGPLGGYSTATRVVFTVEVSDISSVTAASSGDVTADRIEADRLTLATSSSGSVDVGRVLADEVTLRTSSSGAVSVDELEAETLEVELSSSGDVLASGRVGEQEVILSSSGSYRGGDMESADARVRVSSSGTATVWVTGSLDASTSSSGDVAYYGSPNVRESATSSGDVRSLGSK